MHYPVNESFFGLFVIGAAFSLFSSIETRRFLHDIFQAASKGSFTNYVTQRRWVGGLQNVTIPMQLEKFYYAKALLEVGGWSKYQKNRVT